MCNAGDEVSELVGRRLGSYMAFMWKLYNHVHSATLNTELFSHETTFSLCMSLTHCISISVQALTPKLNLSPLPALGSRLVTLTMPTH